MPIRAVVFDADGVVIPPFRFAAYLEREHGLTRAHTREFFQGAFHECLVGRADLVEVLPTALAAWGWSGTVDAFVQRWFDEENAVDPALVAAIASLRQRGVRCALATNRERRRIAYMRSQMRFDDLFDATFCSAEIGMLKSAPRFYGEVERALSLSGPDLLFWDDSAANVACARACGWQAEQYTDYAQFQRVMPGYIPGWDGAGG
jgi:putative hydrolase of the HAD superfamily